jgi:purine-binding chemotaxis protein CheW
MNITTNDNKEQVFQWVTFKLENETYGINVLNVQEVQRYSEISPIPGAADFVLGMINLRGKVITVVDTRAKFGLSEYSIDDDSRILILESDQHVIGLLVDSVAEVNSIKGSEIDDAPNVGNTESSRFIQGVCNKNDTLLVLLDSDKILSEEEMEEIKSLS